MRPYQKWFEVWGTEQAQNRFLKLLLLVVTIFGSVLCLCLCLAALRAPTVIAVSERGSYLLAGPDSQSSKNEMLNFAKEFLEKRHSWSGDNIQDRISKAAAYVAPENQAAFLKANEAQIASAKSKGLSQMAFVSDSVFEENSVTATIQRIVQAGQVRVVSPIKLKVVLQRTERSQSNPYGLAVVSEDLVEEKRD